MTVHTPGPPRGFPLDATTTLNHDDVVYRGLSLHRHLITPIAVLDKDAVEANVGRMALWCRNRGVELQPHAKTAMSPWLIRRQLAAGATGLTVASVSHFQRIQTLAIPEVQVAGQIVQTGEAEWLGRQTEGFKSTRVMSWVDSREGVAVLGRAAKRTGATFDVLLEWGYPGGRGGLRSEAQVSELCDAVSATPGVRLVGVAGYEGGLAGNRSPESLSRVHDYMERLCCMAVQVDAHCSATRREPMIISAGGSMFFDLAAEVLGQDWTDTAVRVILRSGCYAIHDHLLFQRNSPFAGTDQPFIPALTLWTSVVSRPEPGLAILDGGRRDVSYDQGLPVALSCYVHAEKQEREMAGTTLTQLNDQHSFLSLAAADRDIRVGDRVRLGISHPCTTFDKWRAIPVIDRSGVVDEVVRTHL